MRESQDLLARSQAVAHVGSWVFDVPVDRLTWSDEVYRIFGLEPRKFEEDYDAFLECVHPDDRERVDTAYRASLSERQNVYEAEHRIVRRDTGEARWVHEKCTNEFNDAGEVIRSVGMVQDVTARKQAADALWESENYLQSLFRAAPTGIGVVVDRVLKQVNRKLCEMVGYGEEELVGRSARMLYPSDQDYEYVGREKYRQIRDHGTGTVETRWRRKNGDVIDVLLSSTPIDSDDHSKGVTFTALDITERKQALADLRESEARFRALFDNAAEGILVADIETRQFILANPAICEMIGYTKEEFLELSATDIHPPESIEHVVAEFMAQARGEKTLAREIPCLRKDGRIFYANVNASSVELAGRVYSIGLFADVTERLRAERERNRMQKLESLGTIAGGIAHDFNNLLSGVFGNVEMAETGLPEGHTSKTFLEKARGALQSAKNLTGQLLTFAKGGEPELEKVETKELVLETVEFNLHGSSVRSHFDLPGDLWHLNADPGQIGQVLANLTINARDAMSGGGNLYVEGMNIEEGGQRTASGDLSGRCVRLTFRDEGTGIPQNIIDSIFDPYFSTKQAGSGLGLAIAHSVVTRHGGHISVEATPGEGTVFTLYLPAVRAGEAADREEISEKAGGQDLAAKHILFMDDEKMLRDIGSEMMTDYGHTVDTAADGGEALEKYAAAMERAEPFDLVIMDLTIRGGMGGEEAMQKLIEIDPEARVIVSSGYANAPVMANYRDYGFSGKLAKPFQMADLREEISRVMSRRRPVSD